MNCIAAGRMACLILLLQSFYSVAQTPVTTFADWKNNAKGAYTVVHDDFGSTTVSGIENYADTIAYNRGVKFTFGAITGSCDANDWTTARRLVSHGHEVMNHTHNHHCAYDPGWCETSTWANFETELDQSTDLIHDNTEVYPRFFIWPYDLHTQASKNYLRDELNYYGARGGTQNQMINVNQLNPVVIPDFFSINFSVFAPATNLNELNGLIDLAIAEKKWAMRELHGVGDASWGSVPIANYRTHMDYLKTKMLSGDLWVATASEVTTYKMQTQSFVPTTAFNAGNQEITVTWNSPSIDLSDLRSDVTLNVNLDGLTGYIYIYQASTQITQYKIANGILSFNAFPHNGTIVIRKTPWNIFPPGPFTISQGNVCTGQSFTYEVPDLPGNVFEWSYTGSGATISGNGHRVTVTYGPSATSGTLRVRATDASGTSPYNTMAITVNTGYSIQGAERCGPGQVTLSVLTAGQYEWYNMASGGSILGSNNSFQPTVSKDSLFYTQRKTVVNTYNLGKTALTNTATTIWWLPSFAQKITIQKAVTLNTVKIWASGIVNGKVIIISDVTKQVVAQSGLVNVPSNGTVVTVDIPLQPGTYYISMQVTGTHQGAYEGGVASAYTVAGVGSVENRVYAITTNAAGVMSVTNTYNNSFGPMYDLVLKEFIPDVCPRTPVLAKVNPVAVQPAAFTQSSTEICKGSSEVVYTVSSIANVTYNWSYSGNGFSFTGSGNSINASFTAAATNGTLSVTTSNSCGTSAARTLGLTMLNAPAQPGSISGNTSICSGTSGDYSVTQVVGATSYLWTLPGGWSGTSTINSINATAGAGSGNITVSAVNSCGTSAATSQNIVVNTIPSQPGAFTQSSANVCRGNSSVTYTVPLAIGLTYNWSYSGEGFTYTGGNSISASFSSTATSGILSVTSTNSCGTNMARTMNITVNTVPAAPASFTQSSANVCKGNSATYTVPSVAGVTYNWSYSGNGFSYTGSGNSISAAFSSTATSGTLSVSHTNTCGTSTVRSTGITINTVPAAPANLVGAVQPCVGSTQTYSVDNQSGATYNWAYSGNGSFSGSTTHQSQLTYGNTSGPGQMMVTATNLCGNSTGVIFSVMVLPLPVRPTVINGPSEACIGENTSYSVSTVSGMEYSWTYTGNNVALTSSGGNVTVEPELTATAGNLQVVAFNSCGTETVLAKAIALKQAIVPGDFIESSMTVVQGDQDVVYTVPAENGITYEWSYSGKGATIENSGNSVTIDFSMSATSGVLSVQADNGCENLSLPRSVSVQVNPFTSSVQNKDAIQSVLQSYPNPFSGEATVLLRMKENDRVTLKVYDMSGKEISVLTQEEQLSSGDHYYKIENIVSGVYVVRVSGEKYNGGILITAR